jgi:predicted nucleotidyltransferase
MIPSIKKDGIPSSRQLYVPFGQLLPLMFFSIFDEAINDNMRKNLILNNIGSMTEKDSNIARMISSRIKMKDPNAEVILFGSHARGQATEESDWDILILIDRPKKNRAIEDKYRDELSVRTGNW